MLLTSKISLQPKKEVLIERKPPTKMFAKLLHSLTAGLSSVQEKHQTFTAISILQELNIALRRANIVNIVRLAKDGNDFYYDAHGKDNDLAEAMKDFKVNTDGFAATLFNDLELVLEHDDNQLRYLIEIDVKRVHKLNEKPININISAVAKSLEAKSGETPDELAKRIEGLFGDKFDIEAFTARNRSLFEKFTAQLLQTFISAIRCEDYQIDNKVQLLRMADHQQGFGDDRSRAPAPHRGYPGWDTYAMYSFCWMGMMASFGVMATHAEVINSDGEVLQEIGDVGVDAASDNLFDMSIDDSKFNSLGAYSYGDGGFGDSSSWLSGGDNGAASCGGCGGGCGSA